MKNGARLTTWLADVDELLEQVAAVVLLAILGRVFSVHDASVVGTTSIGRVPSMTKWEYLTAPILTHAAKQILDNFGSDGWELVQIAPGMNPENLVGYFKRPLGHEHGHPRRGSPSSA